MSIKYSSMMMITSLLVVVTLCIMGSNASSYYTGAVVDYATAPFPYKTANITKLQAVHYMMTNLDEYEKFIITAKKHGNADIIVFPEYGIFGVFLNSRDIAYQYLEEIPNNTSKQDSPCNNDTYNDRPVIQRLSCLALDYNITIVVDMGDVVYCNNSTTTTSDNLSNSNNSINGLKDVCPSDGRFQYNTQVVFSGEDGSILAKYHKSHLFGNEGMIFNEPSTPTPTTFTAPFGVKFGMMICFDILFERPQTDIFNDWSDVHDLVYSTDWINANYAYAIQIQQAFSFERNANVLASNIGNGIIFSGSGIYSQGQALTTVIAPTNQPVSHLTYSKLPILNSSNINNSFKQRKHILSNIQHHTKSFKFNYNHNNQNNHNNNERFDAQVINNNYHNPIKRSKLDKDNNNMIIVDEKGQEFLRVRGVPPNTFNSTFTIFNPSESPSNTITSINNGFTCTFNYVLNGTDNGSNEQYFALISFNGLFNGYWNSQLCFLTLCADNSEEGCSQLLLESDTQFESVEMYAQFNPGYHVNPMIQTNTPTGSNYYQYYEATQTNFHSFSIKSFNEPLVSISLFSQQWVDSISF